MTDFRDFRPFIDAMIRAMKEHDSVKGDSWKRISEAHLMDKLNGNVWELNEGHTEEDYLANIANYCAMLWLREHGKIKKRESECIYIACRLTATHPIEYLVNVKQGLKAAVEVWRKGHNPFVPGLDLLVYIELDGEYGLGGRMPYDNSMEWLRRCDSILVLNGLEDSKGVQAEVKEAKKLGKKFYWSLEEILPVDQKITCPHCGSGKTSEPVKSRIVSDILVGKRKMVRQCHCCLRIFNIDGTKL